MYRTMYRKERKSMTITDFCKNRNVDAQTIRKYIKRHSEDFTGHTGKKGREITLDEHALIALEDKYPFPAPVEVIEDVEARKKLIQTQEMIIQLQIRIQDQTVALAQAEAAKMLLEDKEQQLQRAYDQCDKLQRELELERNKTWWDKIRGR